MSAPVSRRALLAGAGALAGGAALAACSSSSDATKVDSSVGDGSTSAEHEYIPFYGDHQTGITATHQAQGLMAAFSVVADNRDELVDTFRSLTDESARLDERRAVPRS